MTKLCIKVIDPHHPDYPLEQALRNRVLLAPIGLPPHAWEHHDVNALHFVAYNEQTLIGCMLLRPASPRWRQLMQMAVETEYQRRGVGRALIDAALSRAADYAYDAIYCHARASAFGFYTQLGFQCYGSRFFEVGVEHQYMYRACTANPQACAPPSFLHSPESAGTQI